MYEQCNNGIKMMTPELLHQGVRRQELQCHDTDCLEMGIASSSEQPENRSMWQRTRIREKAFGEENVRIKVGLETAYLCEEILGEQRAPACNRPPLTCYLEVGNHTDT